MKFTFAVNGSITGIRFYKLANDTGPHTGSLWSSTGTQLATVTFTNESISGWQTATFSNPVDITKGTTYVASYHTNGDLCRDSELLLHHQDQRLAERSLFRDQRGKRYLYLFRQYRVPNRQLSGHQLLGRCRLQAVDRQLRADCRKRQWVHCFQQRTAVDRLGRSPRQR